MVQERIPEGEAIVDSDQIEEYIQLSEKLMGYVYRDVVDQATKLASLQGRVLDVGTGFGMLAITLAQRNPTVEVIGLDISYYTLATQAQFLRDQHFFFGEMKKISYI